MSPTDDAVKRRAYRMKVSPERRHEIAVSGGKARQAKLTPEQTADLGRLGGQASVAKLTPEQLRERSRKGGYAAAQVIPTDQRKANGRKGGLIGTAKRWGKPPSTWPFPTADRKTAEWAKRFRRIV